MEAGFAIGPAMGFGWSIISALHHRSSVFLRWFSATIGPVSSVALQGTLLVGALRYSRPPRGAGLGWRPIQRPALLAALVLGQLFATVTWAVIIVRMFGAPSANVAIMLQRSAQSSPWLLGAVIALATLIAPLCEELFFRGWLWTGLRRSWGPGRAAFVTALPWLILHAADGGWRRVLILVPAAVLFSVARHACDSVRASLIMHVSNNGAVAAVVWAPTCASAPCNLYYKRSYIDLRHGFSNEPIRVSFATRSFKPGWPWISLTSKSSVALRMFGEAPVGSAAVIVINAGS